MFSQIVRFSASVTSQVFEMSSKLILGSVMDVLEKYLMKSNKSNHQHAKNFKKQQLNNNNNITTTKKTKAFQVTSEFRRYKNGSPTWDVRCCARSIWRESARPVCFVGSSHWFPANLESFAFCFPWCWDKKATDTLISCKAWRRFLVHELSLGGGCSSYKWIETFWQIKYKSPF